MQTTSIMPGEVILNKIYQIREQKVILDRDLAQLYGVETKVLKQAVKRNVERFPQDFMFEMTTQEFKNWRSQFVTSNSDLMGLRIRPYCFTEQGVAMLSGILNSKQAVSVNIQIMRAFCQIRQALLDNSELRLAIEDIRKKTKDNTQNIELVFQYLDELLDKKERTTSPTRIGYKT